MMKKTSTMFMAFLMLMIISPGIHTYAASSSGTSTVKPKHIKSVTAITEVFGEGQKITAVAIEYDKPINNAKLLKSTFMVKDRAVTKVYTNIAAAKADQGVVGKYVVVELVVSDQAAAIVVPNGRTITRKTVKVSVTQRGSVMTLDGAKYQSNVQAVINDQTINLVVDDFKQFEYKDPATGETLKYNLFVPKNYDKNKSYPLVLFMPDASVTSTVTDMTLVQGLGAVVWATPSEQAKHPCFVLAPQYATQIVNDSSEASEYLDITVNLIHSLASQYTIDQNRIYATGQSGGCMMAIAMNIKYPDLFAASLLVAGQWDPAKVAPLAKDKLWIIVSEGDAKAFPGMNAITAVLEKEGAKVSRATWDGRSTAAEFAADVSEMRAEGSSIQYTVLKKGTVVTPGLKDDPGSNHICTWRIAYTIEGVRNWLLEQVKTVK